jgi:hypothetical protein
MLFQKILQPITHIMQDPGKQFIPKLCYALNPWLKVSGGKLSLVRDLAELLVNHTLL